MNLSVIGKKGTDRGNKDNAQNANENGIPPNEQSPKEDSFEESQSNSNGVHLEGDKVKEVGHFLNEDEKEHIIQALSNHFVFKETDQEVLSLVLNDLIYFPFEKGNVIYGEGDEGNYFYILAKGEVESREKGKLKKKYKQWDCFGEISLITQCKREETVTCLCKVSVFAIDGESFRDIQSRINKSILNERFEFLNSIYVFESLDNVYKYNVCQKLKLKEFDQSDQIICRGDIGDTFYMVKDGLVSCRIGVKEVRKLGSRDYFGQNSVLFDVKRGVDVFALKKTVCYELSRQDLKDALGVNYIDIILFCFFKHCIEPTNYLKNICGENQINEIFHCFNVKTYTKRQKISLPPTKASSKNEKKGTNDGVYNKKILILIEGSIFKEKPFELVAEKGKVIGDEILNDYSQTLPENLIAYPDCIVLEATVEALAKKANIDLNGLKPLNILKKLSKLRKLYLFKNLSEKTLELIATKMKKMKYKEGDIIVEEGTKGDSFFLVSKGRVRITIQGKTLRDLESGNCFGENALVAHNVMRTATVKAIEDVVCYVLSIHEFDLVFEDKAVKEYIQKKISLQDTSITLSDLNYIKFLGKGKFGSVSLVHNKKNIYAIKAVSRLSVDRQKILAKYFVNERRVMLSLDHPFVVKMVKSMRNQYYCFFLIEYVNGKNLDEYLSGRVEKKNIYETQFYIGSMLLMLEYLQKRSIAHRDIKPSNIMIDSNGYLKMIDFGTAKVLVDYTSTVIGTPHYIAPEILKGKGYSLSCDFWSVGICMYEIFYGMYPFGQYASEVIEIYKEILHKEFFFPSDSPKHAPINNFIRDLLTKKVNLRICNVALLKKRPLYQDFEWDKLNDFKLSPPFIPKTTDMTEYLSELNPYEAMVGEESVNFSGGKSREDYVPPGYDRRWADEF